MVSGRKESEKNSNVRLVIVLIVLILVIIGLVVGIVLVRINSDNSGRSDDDGRVDYSMTTEEEKAEFDEYMNRYDAVMAKADELYSHESVSADEILELYGPTIDYYLGKQDYTSAQTFVLMRNSNLIKRGYDREAMDALIAIDYSFFPENLQNRYYYRIISIAERLGEDEIASKYHELADATEAAVEKAREEAIEWEKRMNAPVSEEDDKR